jgi:hypothetical protein
LLALFPVTVTVNFHCANNLLGSGSLESTPILLPAAYAVPVPSALVFQPRNSQFVLLTPASSLPRTVY